MTGDSFGNAHMQWYAQDTVAARKDDSRMFDFSVDPDTKQRTAVENTIWYTAVGNVAIIGFSNAYSWEEVLPHFTRACKWIHGVAPALVILIGHWYGSGKGAPSGMGTEDVYDKIQTVHGCDKLGGRLKYFTGHIHRNLILKKDTGFMFGSNGMATKPFKVGQQLGLPILDTRHGRVKLSYFDLGKNGKKVHNFDEILGCISAKGYHACAHYATVWLDQSLAGHCQYHTPGMTFTCTVSCF